MAISRVKTVRRADRVLRWTGYLALAGALLFFGLVGGNLAYYYGAKRPFQIAKAKDEPLDMLPMPDGAERWRPQPPIDGDPWEDYQQALLDFRAREMDYIALKLRERPIRSDGESFAAIPLLQLAARRLPAAQELGVERQIHGDSLVDCGHALRFEAYRMMNLAAAGDHDATETLRLTNAAEEALRSWYATGHYLATRRFALENIQAGLDVMRESLDELFVFYQDRGRVEDAFAVARMRTDLNPLTDRVARLRSYDDDDEDLEIWVAALRSSNSLAARLNAAYQLAEVAKAWWRYGESTRANRALRAALVDDFNAPIRSALYDLIEAAEQDEELPSLLVGPKPSVPQVMKDRLDWLF